MNEKSRQLAERRERLVAQAAAQRARLARDIEPLRVPMARVDLALSVLRFVKRHPVWLAGGVALVAALRPGYAGAGWVAWRMMQKLRGG
jgi:hypothetical protein